VAALATLRPGEGQPLLHLRLPDPLAPSHFLVSTAVHGRPLRAPGDLVSLDEELDALDAGDAAPTDTELHPQINVQALTPEARLVLERIARPMVEEEITQTEVADRFGQPRGWVSRGLRRLREELEPMLADDGRTDGHP
jgi:hypothetical protein